MLYQDTSALTPLRSLLLVLAYPSLIHQRRDIRFTSPLQAWTAPAQGPMQWESEEAAWPASPPQRCAAPSSPAQPALFIIIQCKRIGFRLADQNKQQHMQMPCAWSYHNWRQQALHFCRTFNVNASSDWCDTLFGLAKEFSSITLSDVRTVAVDPSGLMLSWTPVSEIVRLTASDPKFTICECTNLWDQYPSTYRGS